MPGSTNQQNGKLLLNAESRDKSALQRFFALQQMFFQLRIAFF
jgi:hypothetical protein